MKVLFWCLRYSYKLKHVSSKRMFSSSKVRLGLPSLVTPCIHGWNTTVLETFSDSKQHNHNVFKNTTQTIYKRAQNYLISILFTVIFQFSTYKILFSICYKRKLLFIPIRLLIRSILVDYGQSLHTKSQTTGKLVKKQEISVISWQTAEETPNTL